MANRRPLNIKALLSPGRSWEPQLFALHNSLPHYGELRGKAEKFTGSMGNQRPFFFLPDLLLELPLFWTIGFCDLKKDWIDIFLIYFMGNFKKNRQGLERQIFTL